MRHEYYTPLVGLVEKGGLSNYNPANNTEIVAGFGDVPQNIGVKGTWKNFVLRSGLSYRLTDKSVIRGGYGASIIPFPNNSYAFNFPVKQNFVAPTPANNFVPAGSLAAGFTAPVVFAVPSNGIIDASLPILRNSALYYAPPTLKEGTLHSYNVAFQRELPWNFTAEAAYVGNVGRGILATLDLNAANTLGLATFNATTGAFNDNPARPFFTNYGRTASVNTIVPTDTHYNSLQIKVDRRFTKGLLVTSNYTFARGISNSGDDNGGFSTPANIALDRGRTGFDRTHAVASSFVWQIPFASNTKGLVKWALDGWQITGIFVAQSGTPLDFTTNATDLHAPGNTQRPNLSGEIKVLGGFGPGQFWIDRSVFSTPTATIQLPGTTDPRAKYAPFGQLTRNSTINGPGYWSVDNSIFKKFKFTERIGGEIRADIFNTLNHANPGNPNTSVTAATFGQITGVASSARQVRFGARVTF